MNQRNTQWKSIWDLRLLIGIGMMICFLYSISAFADTYNFYFPSQKQKNKTATSPVETTTNSSEEEQPAEEKSVATETENVAPDKNTQQVKAVSNGQPITINNTNNITVPVYTPVAQPENRTTETISKKHSSFPPWKFSLSTIYQKNPQWGALVGLGLGLGKMFGFNLYLGTESISEFRAAHLMTGLDLEVIPLRIGFTDELRVWELGVLAGFSTSHRVDGNIGSLHGGVRTSLNLTESFGLTAAVRANLGYTQFETGIISRF